MAEKLEDLNLPNLTVQKIIKDSIPESVTIGKDARSALSRAASVFVLYITSQASKEAHKVNRKTLIGQDVLNALEELEFEDFVEPLQEVLKGIILKKKSKESSGSDKLTSSVSLEDEQMKSSSGKTQKFTMKRPASGSAAKSVVKKIKKEKKASHPKKTGSVSVKKSGTTPSLKKKSATSVKKKSMTSVKKKSATLVKKKSATLVKKKSKTLVKKKLAAATPKSQSKTKKFKTGPTKKPKAPKPKTAKTGVSRAPKKVASPKKKT